MKRYIVTLFKDDFIKVGRWMVKPFSVIWFIIRISQCIIGLGCGYALYCGLWLLMY